MIARANKMKEGGGGVRALKVDHMVSSRILNGTSRKPLISQEEKKRGGQGNRGPSFWALCTLEGEKPTEKANGGKPENG